MHPFFNDTKNFVLDTLFPVQCLECSQEGLFLCLSCQSMLQKLTHQQCIICRMPSAFGQTHDTCQRHGAPKGLISAFDYRDPVLARAIIWGKYKFLPDVYKLLGKLLTEYLVKNNYHKIIADSTICAIPLAKARQRWRGFNQAEVISKTLSEHFSLPVVPLLKRIRNTKVQKDLTKAERTANIANSFAITDEPTVQNKNIILIDDVITTGETLLEATRMLKLAGVEKVWCVTVARD